MRKWMTILAAFATVTTGAVATGAAPEASAQSWRGGERAADWRRDDRRRWNHRRDWRSQRHLRDRRDWRGGRDWRRDRWRDGRRWNGGQRFRDPRAYGGRPCNYIRRNGRVVCV